VAIKTTGKLRGVNEPTYYIRQEVIETAAYNVNRGKL